VVIVVPVELEIHVIDPPGLFAQVSISVPSMATLPLQTGRSWRLAATSLSGTQSASMRTGCPSTTASQPCSVAFASRLKSWSTRSYACAGFQFLIPRVVRAQSGPGTRTEDTLGARNRPRSSV
jgi:hypothetical protein